MLKTKLELIDNNYEWRRQLTVLHYGETILTELDGGEPEDNTFVRDWAWVPGIIERAYELGLEDGKAEIKQQAFKGKEAKKND
jgi:hypothetical protein